MLERQRALLQGAIKDLNGSSFYYDLDGLSEYLKNINRNLDPGIKLWYACKANPLSKVLEVFKENGFGFDVASYGELDQTLQVGVEADCILATGPAKTKRYLKHLLNHNVNIVVLESLNQAYWLSEIASEMNKNPKVLLRLQASWQKGHSVIGGDEITPFGLSPDDWKKIDLSRCENIDIVGVHIFQWANILNIKRLHEIWDESAKLGRAFFENLGFELKVIDFGGGIGIPYTASEKALDFKDISNALTRVRERYQIPELWLELGRYAVGNHGLYLCKIIDRKSVRDREILVLESGINHISRAALTSQYFPCETLESKKEKEIEFHVHGPLCTALDKLGVFHFSEDIAPGDWLVFKQVGAYGFTESMPYFLCHHLPGEAIIKNGRIEIVRNIAQSTTWRK